MKILSVNSLSPCQKEQVARLVQTCCHHDKQQLSMAEDADSYYLGYDNHTLAAAICFYRQQEDLWECSAFTHPDYRRLGFFTALLDAAEEELEAEEKQSGCSIQFLFAVHPSVKDTQKSLEALGAEFWYEEHIMELSFVNDENPSGCRKKTAADDSPFTIQPDHNGFCICNSSHQKIGEFFTAPAGEGKICFYGFEIQEALRHQGLGSACFPVILDFLKETSCRSILLQVSGNNAPAFSLYKKTGFRITETLSYYVY